MTPSWSFRPVRIKFLAIPFTWNKTQINNCSYYIFAFPILVTELVDFIIVSTFGSFTSELHDVRMAGLWSNWPLKVVNITLWVTKHTLPAEKYLSLSLNTTNQTTDQMVTRIKINNGKCSRKDDCSLLRILITITQGWLDQS